jgi:hypothetical protein
MMDQLDFYPASPVLSDRWLFSDELPFTAFGQHGHDQLDLRVFEQDIWWVDRYGQEHLLSEMTTDYLRNVKMHMINYGKGYHDASKLRYSIEVILANSDISKRTLYDFPGFSSYVARKINPGNFEWFVWLESTPLYRRIGEILETRA